MDLFFKINIIIIIMVKCKQLLASAIIISYFFSGGLVFSDKFQGYAEKFDKKTLDKSELFTRKINIIEEKDYIKMRI